MADDLDSIVKGASAAVPTVIKGTTPISPVQGKAGDPLNNTPSSPAMIYLNLLILEASLRAQYLELRARKRHHTFFVTVLALWVSFFGYKLYFAPREDGQGVGGSIYWAVEGAQKVCFMGGIITAMLLWATGIWERGIRWPRRWFAISNRGLRPFNCKLVVIRQPWWMEVLSTVGFFLTYGLFSHTASSSYRYVEPSLLREVEKEMAMSGDSHPLLVLPHDDTKHGHEEDLAPGGDYVKLLLLAKPFSPNFRENWELYRTEYWERENERRALLRQKVKEYDLKLSKQQFGWFWWLPWKRPHHKRETASKSGHKAVDKEHRRRTSSVRRSSVSSSRSFTPSLDMDDGVPSSRRTGSISSMSDKRRRKPSSLSKPKKQGTDSRSVTPDLPSPLSRESTNKSEASPDAGRVLRSSGGGSKTNTPSKERKSSPSE
ncbi:Putative Spo7-like protein [[Torrubiella] hemipterigena]|uniref:Putative Spo7-like protein n=1 Tax=[Torrubiella] hemipterigena TaxID=1531966 RepID=A0A0A1TBT2_9HYPO|nr:Putative Spo7-like protein [[Torrubiella] hemipterigena]